MKPSTQKMIAIFTTLRSPAMQKTRDNKSIRAYHAREVWAERRRIGSKAIRLHLLSAHDARS